MRAKIALAVFEIGNVTMTTRCCCVNFVIIQQPLDFSSFFNLLLNSCDFRSTCNENRNYQIEDKFKFMELLISKQNRALTENNYEKRT